MLLDPPLSQTVTPSRILCSSECDVHYGRPLMHQTNAVFVANNRPISARIVAGDGSSATITLEVVLTGQHCHNKN